MGYAKHDQHSRSVSNNYRKGRAMKTINTECGSVRIAIPRDNNASFEPIIVPKYERNALKVEDLLFNCLLEEPL